MRRLANTQGFPNEFTCLSEPVLLATPKPSVAGAVFQNLSAAEFYRQVADEQQVPLIEDAIAGVFSDPQMKADPLHPNAAGHVQLSQNIFDALKSMSFPRKIVFQG